ncbi:MAG: acyltransferase [Candidatus Woesearchaeota archaeon]
MPDNYYKQIKKEIKEFLKDDTKKVLAIPYKGKRLNAGCDWYKVRSWLRICFSSFIVEISHKIPPCRFKNWLLCITGANIGKDVCIPNDVSIDHIFPDLITLEDGVLIGSGSYVAAHEFIIDRTNIGRVKIKKKALIGARTIIRPGVTIGKNSIIGMFSFVNKDIPDNEFWSGVPAKFIKKLK